MATARIDIETTINPDYHAHRSSSLGPFLSRPAYPASKASRTSLLDIARDQAIGIRTVPAGTDLFAEGEASNHLYIVLEGWLFLHRILGDGRRQILDFALPGTVLGYRPDPESPFAFSVEAVTPSEVAVIPISRMNRLLCTGTESAVILLDAANDSLLGAFDSLTDIGRRTAREAVAHFFLRMERRIRECARPRRDGAILFPLCQEHIGDALGLTSVHVCRTISKLRKEGLVELSRGHLRIPNIGALSEEAGVFNIEDDNVLLAS